MKLAQAEELITMLACAEKLAGYTEGCHTLGQYRDEPNKLYIFKDYLVIPDHKTYTCIFDCSTKSPEEMRAYLTGCLNVLQCFVDNRLPVQVARQDDCIIDIAWRL